MDGKCYHSRRSYLTDMFTQVSDLRLMVFHNISKCCV